MVSHARFEFPECGDAFRGIGEQEPLVMRIALHADDAVADAALDPGGRDHPDRTFHNYEVTIGPANGPRTYLVFDPVVIYRHMTVIEIAGQRIPSFKTVIQRFGNR